MSYTNDVIPLAYGLDLVEPKPLAASGSLAVCRNYEITDKAGLRRIDGFERFDGRLGGECDKYWQVSVSSPVGSASLGDVLAVDTFGAIGTTTGIPSNQLGVFVLGVVVQVVNSTSYIVAVINEDLFPVVRDEDSYVTSLATGVDRRLFRLNKSTKTLVELGNLSLVRDLRFFATSPQDQYTKALSYMTYLRSTVSSLPGPAVMTYRHKGINYAAAGANTLELRGSSAGAIVVSSVPNTVVGNSFNGATARVLGYEVITISGEDRVVISYEDLNTGSWDLAAAAAGTTITGLTATIGGVSLGGGLSLVIFGKGYSPDKAVMFTCGAEQAESVSDYFASIHGGWKFFNTGWAFSFDTGNSHVSGQDEIPKYERGLSIPTPGTFQYWISDGTNTFTVDLNTYKVASGAFSAGNAVGTMQVTKVVRVAGTAPMFTVGYSVYNSATLTTPNRVAVITSAPSYNFLPGISALQRASSRYVASDYNYYGLEDLDAVYVATGASKAFYFNRERLIFINDSTPDTEYPRHTDRIANSLALGYADGMVRISVTGEPWNYSGIDGAAEFAMGYPVRGLLSMPGDTLGVFCSNGVFAIQGSVPDNFLKRVILPKTGAVEYTAVSLGDIVFCSHSGVVALSQSDKYGDFVGIPISYKLSPIIRPKTSANGAIVCAIPIRTKNQYKIFSADGDIFTFTFNEGRPVQGTTQTLYLGLENFTDVNGKEFVPLALSSVLDHDGIETVLASHYSPTSRVASNYLYRLDSGWGFDGKAIKAEFDVNWYFAGNPFGYKVMRKVRVDGVSRGLASLRITTAKDYENEYQSTLINASIPDRQDFIKQGDTPYTNMANVAERGLNVSIKVLHEPSINAPEPSHTLQTLFIQFTPTKVDA